MKKESNFEYVIYKKKGSSFGLKNIYFTSKF
jgi:hypothetical protein